MTTDTVTDSPHGRSQPCLQPLIIPNALGTEHLEPGQDDSDDPNEPADPDEPSEEGLSLDDDLVDERHPERRFGDLSLPLLPQIDEVDEEQELDDAPQYELSDESVMAPDDVRHLRTFMISSGWAALLQPAARSTLQLEEHVEQAEDEQYPRRASTIYAPRLSTIHEFDADEKQDEDDEDEPMDEPDRYPVQHEQLSDPGIVGQPERARAKRKLRSVVKLLFSKRRRDPVQ